MKQSKAKPVDVADAAQLCVSYVGLETDSETLHAHTRARMHTHTHTQDKSSNQRPTFGVPFDTTSDLVDNAARRSIHDSSAYFWDEPRMFQSSRSVFLCSDFLSFATYVEWF